MQIKMEDIAEEVRLLRSFINDLMSLLALPAVWSGRRPPQIIETLLDALLGILRVDFAYARLNDPALGPMLEAARLAERQDNHQPQEACRKLGDLLSLDACASSAVIPNPFGEGQTHIARYPLVIKEGAGIVVVGSRRAGFPTENESLLLKVAANQAAIALDNARLFEIVQRERAKVEAAQKVRMHLAAIVESSGDAIISKSLEGTILSWNEGATQIFGYSADEVIGKSIYILIPPDRMDEEPMILEKLKLGERIDHYETVRVRKDGRPVDVSLSVSPIKDVNGRIIAASKIARDITGRKLMEQEREQLLAREKAAREQAEQANRLKDEFLATVSHELRTPLNAMLGWTRMLRTGSLDEQTYERALETIERNAKSQAQLIEDILDVSRIVSGKMRLDVQPVELAPVIQMAVDSVRPGADAKSIRLSVVLDPRAGPVSGDPTRLQQVIWNLLSNAIKFTPKQGRVQVRLERINSHIEITVSDTGIGISPEFLPYVFDRFRQADGTLTRCHAGLGLGLSIVRHLVEMHGGSIHCYSAGEGQGTTFTINLPIMIVRDTERFPTEALDRKHPTASIDLPFECPKVLEGLRVLAVDDEPDARQLLAAILERCKAEVITVGSAEEALDALERQEFDVVVSDIEMPGEDGYSFIRKVREKEASQDARIAAAALTAHAGVADRMRALSAGFDIHVPKPVEPAELIAVMASLANRMRRDLGA
ncbi:MAG TPA: ATP-binding protein [Blastocatellia bacterium]|nr:ATP-binding protein [Blastocatellia bacterium]